MTFDIFIRKVGRKFRCYLKEDLARTKIMVGEGESATELVLDTPEKVEEFFASTGGGEWHTITIVEPFTGYYYKLVEQALWEVDPNTKQRFQNRSRWADVVIEKAVSDWTLTRIHPDWTPTEEGLNFIPYSIGSFVKALVTTECYNEVEDPAFTNASMQP